MDNQISMEVESEQKAIDQSQISSVVMQLVKRMERKEARDASMAGAVMQLTDRLERMEVRDVSMAGAVMQLTERLERMETRDASMAGAVMERLDRMEAQDLSRVTRQEFYESANCAQFGAGTQGTYWKMPGSALMFSGNREEDFELWLAVTIDALKLMGCPMSFWVILAQSVLREKALQWSYYVRKNRRDVGGNEVAWEEWVAELRVI